MSKAFIKELAELEQASIITPDTAERIRTYYAQKPGQASNRLVIVFGILGALLTGLGIILIIAHNWDVLGKVPKLGLALLPLLLGQAACAFTLLRRSDSTAWREGSATFLFLSIGAAIAIVSQVYQIDGTLGGFLLIWMLLAFPIQYILKSSVASMVFLGGITWYACDTAYATRPYGVAWWYLALLALSFPYYYRLYRDRSESNFFAFHAWMLPLSLLATAGMFNRLFFVAHDGELTVMLYMNVLSLLVLIGHVEKLRQRRLIANGFLVCGSLGTIGMLLFFTFKEFWNNVSQLKMAQTLDFRGAAPYWISFLLTLGLLLYRLYRKGALLNAKVCAFVILLALFIIGFNQPAVSHILANVVVFVFGVFTIRDGARQNKLSILNYGLLILTLLIVCRFFDTDMSFVARGLLFMTVGVGFFVANMLVLRKRRNAS